MYAAQTAVLSGPTSSRRRRTRRTPRRQQRTRARRRTSRRLGRGTAPARPTAPSRTSHVVAHAEGQKEEGRSTWKEAGGSRVENQEDGSRHDLFMPQSLWFPVRKRCDAPQGSTREPGTPIAIGAACEQSPPPSQQLSFAVPSLRVRSTRLLTRKPCWTMKPGRPTSRSQHEEGAKTRWTRRRTSGGSCVDQRWIYF
jgi:hypothetical protein